MERVQEGVGKQGGIVGECIGGYEDYGKQQGEKVVKGEEKGEVGSEECWGEWDKGGMGGGKVEG